MHQPQSLNVRVKTFTLTRSDSTSTKRCSLPDGAIILDILETTSVLSAGAQLDVGDSSNDDRFVAALDVATAQKNVATLLDTYTALSGMTDVYAHIQGAPGAGGPYRVSILYTDPAWTRR